MRNASNTESVDEKETRTNRDCLLQTCRAQIQTDMMVLLREELQAFREEQERWRQEVLEDMRNSQRGKRMSYPAITTHNSIATEMTATGVLPVNYSSEASSTNFRLMAFNAGKSFTRAGTVTKKAMLPNFAKTLSEDTREAEKVGCRFFSKMLDGSRWLAVLTLMIFLASFFIWGLVKICNPENYTEIKSETLPWTGEMELPQLAVSQSGNVTIRIQHCTIRNGNADSKTCLDVGTKACTLGDHHYSIQQECMPSLSVAGTFGDAHYRYVTMKLFSPKGSSEAWVSLWWEQRESPTWTGVLTQMYSCSEKVPMRSELFFQKVVALQGESFGLFGRHGNDESEQLLKQNHFMVKKREYAYAGQRGMTNSQGLILGGTIFLRAAHTQQENFYEVYSLMRLLEAMGGLYTSFSFVLFVPILFAYKLMRHGALLMDRYKDRYKDRGHCPRTFRRLQSTKMPVEEVNFEQSEPRGGSQDTQFALDQCSPHSPLSKVPIMTEASASNLNPDTCVKLPGMLTGDLS